MAFNFKTATPDTSIDANAFMFGADSQSASTPSIYQMSVVQTLMWTSPSLVTPNIGAATGTSLNLSSSKFVADNAGNLSLTRGVLAAGSDGAFTGSFTDGLVLDYVSPTARFSAGTSDGFGWYNGGVGTTTLMTLSSGSALTLGVQQTTQGSIVLANTAVGAFATTIKASNSATAAWTLTLPVTAGSSGQVLNTNGSGVTSWTNALGAISSASLAINGATIGSNALAVTGIVTLGNGSGNTTLKSTTNWNFSNLDIIRNSSNTATPRLVAMMLDSDSTSATTIGAYNSIWGIYTSAPTTGSTSSALSGEMAFGAYFGFRFYLNGTRSVNISSTGKVGVGINTPLNLMDLNGSLGRNAPVTKTGDFTLADTENWIINNKSGSSCTVTFPAASSWTGREVMILNYQAQTVISASSNVIPLTGGAAGTAILDATAGKWATLVSNGTNWVIMHAN